MLKTYLHKDVVEAGCDEAGRGCMAGPVTAAAVILDPGKPIEALNDSKKLSAKKREELAIIIKEEAMAWGIAMVSPEKIDEINILNASILAMHKALESLNVAFTHILVDGNRFHPYRNIQHTCIIKGDAKYQNIAAASILAKTSRDEFMIKIHNDFPQYGWAGNKGYATKKHTEAMLKFGRSEWHRNSFKLHQQLKIQF